jgi:hypothetical protein
LVLNLRLMERAELTVKQAFGSVEGFEKYLNGNVAWIFEQTERRYVNNKWIKYPPSTIMLVGNSKVVLARPRMNKENFYFEINYVVLTVLTATRNDRTEALAGNEVKERIRIYDHGLLPATSETGQPAAGAATQEPSSSEIPSASEQERIVTCPVCGHGLTQRDLCCSHCRHELPPSLAVHRQLVVAIRKSDYDKLATYAKQEVNLAWNRLLIGRKVDKRASSMGQTIFLVRIRDENHASTLVDEERLDRVLADTCVGRISSDPYEVRKAEELTARARHEE